MIEEWAKAISRIEGYYPGSRSFINNNPGNLRWSPTQAGTKGGFAYFKTYNDGWKALVYQLTIAVNGKSRAYSPEDTLYLFFSKYAPAHDANDPKRYAESVAKMLGVKPSIKIKNLA